MISKDKKYRTRDGRPVRIYATDGEGSNAVHGAILHNGTWIVHTWRADGGFAGLYTKMDLVEVKPRIKRTVWLNVYPDNVFIYSNRESADFEKRLPRLACVKVEIDVEHGEGL